MSTFGIVAEFKTTSQLVHVATQLRDAGYTRFDTHSPFPIHGMDDAMGLKPSKLGWIVFFGGAFGFSAGLGLQSWASTKGYALIISGKPFLSFEAFVPVTFELMILFAAFGAVFGMFALNKLPEWYHSLFNHPDFSKITSHGFFVSVEAKDPLFDVSKTGALLKDAGGQNVSLVEE
jgi:hypothetical protein